MWWYPNKTLIRLSCLIYFFALNARTTGTYVSPRVTIINGTLEGAIIYTRLNKEIYAYQGIPYAAPPVKELRFKPPQPASAWNETRQAVEVPQLCTQKDIFTLLSTVLGNEDCLYLNVYTPIYEQDSLHQYPVMVWFHGGGWICGAGHYFQPDHLLDYNVILVTVNYRLGPLGFLSTEDLECPGNLGLKDQQQALRWVQENIAYFHGDPKNVIIFGESAGGASVHYHMINPLSKGLFHRAISQSGTFYNPWASMPPGSAKKNAETLGNYLNCTTENSKKLIECLRTKNAKEITDTNHIFSITYNLEIPFRPVIEPKHSGAFLTEDPLISAREGRIADVPWIMGLNSQEGSIVAANIYGRKLVKKFNNEFMKYAPSTLLYQERYQLVDQNFVDEITNDIRKYYFAQNQIDETDKARFDVVNMYSDALFNHGIYTAVRDFTANQTSPLYFYYLTYRGSSSFSSTFGDPFKDYGVAHADDLLYLFPIGRDFFQTKLTKDDEDMIELFVKLWCNFAISGNPTPETMQDSKSLKWSPSVKNLLKYLRIDKEQTKMESEFLTDRMSFWDNLENRMKSKVNKNYTAL